MGSDDGRRREKVGICLSGGGIRAAAFGLGALEALEERTGLVQGGPSADRNSRQSDSGRAADYLVAVSGGSYIAGAIAMLRSRFELPKSDPATASTADEDAQPADEDAELAEEQPNTGNPRVFAPGSDEVEFVRRRAQYLLRSCGGLIDLVSQFLVRLLLNVAFIALPFAVLGRVTGWAYGWRIRQLPGSGVMPYMPVLYAGVGLVGLGLLGAGLFVLAPSLRAKPEGSRRVISWLIGIGLVVVFIALVPAIVSWLAGNPDSKQDLNSPAESRAGLVATIAAIGSVLTAVAALLTKAQPAITAIGRFPKLRAFAKTALRGLLAIAAALLAPIALLALYVWMVQQGADHYPGSEDGWILDAILVSAGTALWGLIAFLAEPTAWSLHQFYKRALMSCFCIGWKRNAGLSVSERSYAPQYIWPGWSLPERPELVIAAAATISTFGAAPAGQNVLPFVISKREIGFSNGWHPDENVTAVGLKPGVGARFDTEALINACRAGHSRWPSRDGARNISNLTLPASVAITGAAISPSMGKRTIPPIRMLLALFNLRLGVWLPNPENEKIRKQVIEEKKLRRSPAARHTLREYLGSNNREGSFVYVSDGGHYENLGLVETLRRECTTVYCIDASGDPPGDPRTLTEAMRLATAELGISWDPSSSKALADLALRRDASGAATGEGEKADAPRESPPRVNQTWTTLRFHDKFKRPGRVHVIKTSISDITPEYLRAYQVSRPTFPYDGTGNQLFRADRFDAYRELGYHSAMTALRAITKDRSTQSGGTAKKPAGSTRGLV